MPWDLSPFSEAGLTAGLMEGLLGEHERQVRPRLDRLWSYYRNPARPATAGVGARPSAMGGVPGLAGGVTARRLAQAGGLPERLLTSDHDGRSKEIVIENDIGWRIDTLVDFLFGKPIRMRSTARDEGLRSEIEALLGEAWEASGGVSLLQDMALLGSVYGSADLVVRGLERDVPRIELVEAPRGIAVLDPGDYRKIVAYVIVASKVEPSEGQGRMLGSLWRRVRFGASADEAASGDRVVKRVVEVLSASHRQVYEDGRLVVDEANGLGELPVVHVQNASQPFRYEGLSDVEPLVPLQDELNTRLSDRAHRVTLQSFNMYLVKGLDFGPAMAGLRVSPGQVWMTDNPEAQVQSFGGDGHSPSEDRHIDELREA
ncbi:MAG: phage portal protein, partial [Phycisphaerae bacterium]|nr:phage portal protein [Phycisphaerae bacterium]